MGEIVLPKQEAGTELKRLLVKTGIPHRASSQSPSRLQAELHPQRIVVGGVRNQYRGVRHVQLTIEHEVQRPAERPAPLIVAERHLF